MTIKINHKKRCISHVCESTMHVLLDRSKIIFSTFLDPVEVIDSQKF